MPAKGDSEDLLSIGEQVEKDLPARCQMQPVEDREITRQSDREGGENDVEADREGKLDACQQTGPWWPLLKSRLKKVILQSADKINILNTT